MPANTAEGWRGRCWNRLLQIIEKLNREINAGLADAMMKWRFSDLGITPQMVSPAQYAEFVAAETEKFAKAVKISDAELWMDRTHRSAAIQKADLLSRWAFNQMLIGVATRRT